jgi:WD40 repeat protein/serine/threonine protein kinase
LLTTQTFKDFMTFCPHCDAPFQITAIVVGQQVRCPSCTRPFVVSQREGATSVPQATESENPYQRLLLDELEPEKFVRQSLQVLENDFRELALLAIADWARLEIVSHDLFQSIATLQRPSWGHWNGILTALRKARNSVLRSASNEVRQKVEQATFVRSLLDALDVSFDQELAKSLFPLRDLIRGSLPRKPKLISLLTLPIGLRNRVAHDAPTDQQWWQTAADALQPLVKFLIDRHPRYLLVGETTEFAAPWFLVESGVRWSFNGLANDMAVVYVSPTGAAKFSAEHSHAILQQFQQLLGKLEQQEDDFRRILSKLAPEDIKGVMLGDYLVGRPVGSGGFATVHVGTQLSTGRKMAIKLLHDGQPERIKERFQQEARFLSRLVHPNIVSVFGNGEETWSAPRAFSLSDEEWFQAFAKSAPTKSYIAMEWVEGGTLDDQFKQPASERPSTRQLAEWFAQSASSLSAVHNAGLVHRDIKPSNLMVNDEGQIKLMDFGIARSLDKERTLQTTTGSAFGTPAYMSPEQIRSADRDAEVGPPTDIYSLCATFYELFAQRRIYDHDTVGLELVTTKKLSGDPPERLSINGKKLPWELETIVMGGLQADVSDRYRTMDELKRDIDHFLADEPIQYRKPTLARRIRLGYRRNRTLSNVVAIFLLIALIGTGYYLSSLTAKNRDLVGANKELDRKRQEAVELQQATTQNLYDAEIVNAGVSLTSISGIGQVREMVEHWSPERDKKMLGWEWYFLDAISHREQRVLESDQYPNEVHWHPDNETIALTGIMGTTGGVYLANVDADDAFQGFISANRKNSPQSLCWGPRGDWLAASQATFITAWDYPSKKLRWEQPFPGEDFGPLCYCPVLNLLAARSRNGRIYILNADNGSVVKDLPDHKGKEPKRIGFSPNGRWLASCWNRSDGVVIKVWNTDDWSSYAELPVADGMLFTLAWSPDSRSLAVGGDEANIQIFDVRAKELSVTLERYHDRRIIDLAWHPDNERLASCSEDFTIVISQPFIFETFDRLRGHLGTVQYIDWSADGKRLISVGSKDYEYRIWNLEESPPDEEINLKMNSPYYAGEATLDWHPHQNQVVISLDGPGDAEILSWNTKQRKREVIQQGLSPTWSHDGKYLAAIVDQQLRIYLANGKLYKQIEFDYLDENRDIHRDDSFSLDWHPQRHVLALTTQKELSVWDIEDDQPRLLCGDLGHLRAVAWSPDGKKIAVGSMGMYLDLYEAASGELLRRSPAIVDLYTTDIAWSPEGSRIASSAMSKTEVMLWDAETLTQLDPFQGNTYGVWKIAWSPDGARLASSGQDEKVRIWNTRSQKLLLTFDHHMVDGIGWSSDGKRLAAVSKRGRLKIWDASAGYAAAAE